MTQTDKDCDTIAQAVMRCAMYYYTFPYNIRPLLRFARDGANAIIKLRADEARCIEHDNIIFLNDQE